MTETKNNKKKPTGFFSSSLLLIISFVIALVLWYMGTLRDQTPISKTFTDVPVEFINMNQLEEKSLTAEELGATVTVSVVLKGYLSDMNAINEEDLVAQIDLSEQTSVGTFKVTPKISGCAPEIETTKIDKVEIKIEKLIKKSLFIELETVGELKPGFKINTENIEYTNEVEIVCGETISAKVIRAKIVVDISDLDKDFFGNVNIMLVDTRGNIVSAEEASKINFEYYSVKVKIPIVEDTQNAQS